jgi:hypothetical protein
MEQYTSREAIEAAKAGKPLPAGTVITSANYKAVLDPQGNPIRDAKGNFMAGELDRVVGLALVVGVLRLYGRSKERKEECNQGKGWPGIATI